MKWNTIDDTTKLYDRMAIQAILTVLFGAILALMATVLIIRFYSIVSLVVGILFGLSGFFFTMFWVALSKAKEINSKFEKKMIAKGEKTQ